MIDFILMILIMFQLEVGCGHAGYIMYALGRNSGLSVIGLELDPQVAESARRAVGARGLGDRVTIMVQDVREFHAHEQFDILTLYNNIYYWRSMLSCSST
jgi:4-hydroxy-2,2'-bipyrrole-5-carbaldehyde O-methyltransferase